MWDGGRARDIFGWLISGHRRCDLAVCGGEFVREGGDSPAGLGFIVRVADAGV